MMFGGWLGMFVGPGIWWKSVRRLYDGRPLSQFHIFLPRFFLWTN